MTVELLRCWLCSKVKAEASGKHEGLHCSLEGRFRLGAAAELRQACDRCGRYQTLTRDLAKRPLYASNRKLAGFSAPQTT